MFPYFPAAATTCPTSGDNVTIAANCTFDAGTYTFTGTLTINSGVVVTAASNVGAGQVIIISDSIDVQGTIDANSTGYAGGSGPGVGTGGSCSGGGGGHGGRGGEPCVSAPGGTTHGDVKQPSDRGSGGATSSGTGGIGGGSVKLSAPAGTITVGASGVVRANGGNGAAAGGGGAGGSIWIDAGTLAGSGQITANGATGETSGGGGGGGRIALYYDTDSSSIVPVAQGGSNTSGSLMGGAGTVFRDDKNDANANGMLIVDNNDQAGTANNTLQFTSSLTFDSIDIREGARYVIPSTMTITLASGGAMSGGGTTRGLLTVNSGGTFNLPGAASTVSNINVTNNGSLAVSGGTNLTDLTVSSATLVHNVSTGSFDSGNLTTLTAGSGGTFSIAGTSVLTVGTITVLSGGNVSHETNPASPQTSNLSISATTVDVQTGGTISVNAKGFAGSVGTGAGTGGSCSGGGGGHGGRGGEPCVSAVGGTTYGDVKVPVLVGSGGATSSGTGGFGGGYVKLNVSGTLTVNGNITADGGNGSAAGGGGAGGSIHIIASTLAGGGNITANGGSGTSGGPGGGGRISVNYATDSSTIVSGFVADSNTKIQARGNPTGSGSIDGGAGTVFIDDTDDANANGTYVVDNNDLSTGADTLQVATNNYTFDSIILRKGSEYVIPANTSLTLAAGTLTTSGTQRPTLTINGGSPGGTFNVPTAAFTFSGINVTNNGTVAKTGTGSGNDLTDLTLTNSTFVHNLATAAFDSGNLTTLTAGSGGTFSVAGTSTLTVGTITVQSGGSLSHEANTSTEANKLVVSATTMDVQTGGTVSVNAKGFSESNGTGVGQIGSCSHGGAGYGGKGGNACGSNGFGGTTYGNVKLPVDLGSGGEGTGGGNAAGAGAGAARLTVSGTLTVDGNITADGGAGSGSGGGGSGGSLLLTVGTLAGGGNITANGGTGSSGGAGGGGRISVNYATDSSTIVAGFIADSNTKIQARGNATGGGTIDGGAGTVFIDDTDDANANGAIVVDNNNLSAGNDTLQTAATSITFDDVRLRKGAKYVVPANSTFTVASSGTLSGGGSIRPSITTNSGSPAGAFNLPSSTYSLSAFDVTNNGTLGGVTVLTVVGVTLRNAGSIGSGLTSLTVGSGANFIQTSTAPLFSGSTLTIQSGGTFTQDNTTQIAVTTVTVESGGTITHSDNTTAKNAIVNIAATTIDVQLGGAVNANNLGFDPTTGNGQGNDGSTAGGASHCAVGGNGSSGTLGSTVIYGSSADPDTIGSGGGHDTNSASGGGAGGGEIRLIASGTLTVAGTITANGQTGTAGEAGGGSGGSIRLDAGTWAGGGSISANGGGGSPATSSSVGGGGGGAGYVTVYYGVKTFSGATASTGGPKGGNGGSSAATAGGNCTPSEVQNAPTITSITHSPANPTATDPVTLSATATYGAGIKKIDLYLDGSPPSTGLVRTCNFSPSQTPASCSVNAGALSNTTHTFTAIATGDDDSTSQSQDVFGINGQTTSGTLTLSRLKAGVTGVDFSLTFILAAADTGNLTVTFPAGFTVTQAFQSGTCSGGGTVGTFGFTALTLTGIKNSCAGTVTLSGAKLTNPATPGEYVITWSNDSGSGAVYIIDDDQVTISGTVDPSISFNVGSQTVACDGTFSGNGGTVGLGVLTTSSVATSDVSSVPHVCTRVSTNAASGAVVQVRSENGQLESVSVPADAIPSASATLVAGTAGYGMCVGSAAGDVGKDATTPAGATPVRAAPFNGSCDASNHAVGGLTVLYQDLWTISGPSQNAFARIWLKASISATTPAHADYADTLTFVVTGTY